MNTRFMASIRRFHLDKVIFTALLMAVLIAWLFPAALAIMTSFKSDAEMINGPFALPKTLDFSAYVNAWNLLDMGRQLWNTFCYALFGSLLAMLLSAIPAYALGRFKIPGGKWIFIILLTGMMLPQQTVVIPLLALLRKLQLDNTALGLIIVHGVYGMPSQLLILRGFVENIPWELEGAARVDGASDIGVFRYVIFPLLMPAVAVSFTLNFINIWKEFFFALIFLNDGANYPVTMGILKVTNAEYFTSWNLPSAALIIAQLPIVILFIFTYRWITKGVFAGAIKG